MLEKNTVLQKDKEELQRVKDVLQKEDVLQKIKDVLQKDKDVLQKVKDVLQTDKLQKEIEVLQKKTNELRKENEIMLLRSLPQMITIESLQQLFDEIDSRKIQVDIHSDPLKYRDSLIPDASGPAAEEESSVTATFENMGHRSVSMRKFDPSYMLHPPTWTKVQIIEDDEDMEIMDSLIMKEFSCTPHAYQQLVTDLAQVLDRVRSIILATAASREPSCSVYKGLHKVWKELDSLQPLAALYFQYVLQQVKDLVDPKGRARLVAFPANCKPALSFHYTDKTGATVACSGYTDLAILPVGKALRGAVSCNSFKAVIELKAPVKYLMGSKEKEVAKNQLLAQLLSLGASKSSGRNSLHRGVLTDLFSLYVMVLRSNEVIVSRRIQDSQEFVRCLLYVLFAADPLPCFTKTKRVTIAQPVVGRRSSEDSDDEDREEEKKEEERKADSKAPPPHGYATRSATRAGMNTSGKQRDGFAGGKPSAVRMVSFDDPEERIEEYTERARLVYHRYMKYVLKEPLLNDENLENRRRTYAEDKKMHMMKMLAK